MKLVLATNNSHKTEELQMMLNEEGFESVELSSSCLIFHSSQIHQKPARPSLATLYKSPLCLSSLRESQLSAADKIIVLADDSGLVVRSLNGAPGVRSKHTP